MRQRRAATPRDPDFDPPPRNRPGPNANVLKFYQRLVVNPFLALVVMVGLAMVIHSTDQPDHHNPLASVFGFSVVFGYPLVQIHCLDCGGTGRFGRWKKHACASVHDRWDVGRLTNFPSATVQLVFWLVGLLFCVMASEGFR